MKGANNIFCHAAEDRHWTIIFANLASLETQWRMSSILRKQLCSKNVVRTCHSFQEPSSTFQIHAMGLVRILWLCKRQQAHRICWVPMKIHVVFLILKVCNCQQQHRLFFGTILTLLFVVLVKVKKENYFSLNHSARALEIFVIPQKYSESMNDLFSVNMREAWWERDRGIYVIQ